MDYPGSCKVAIAMAKFEIGPKLREPPAAPSPIGKKRIPDGRKEHRRHREGGKLPPLGRCAGHDSGRRIHKDHLEKEQNHNAHVIAVAREEKALGAEEAPVLTEQRELKLAVERVDSAQVGDPSRATLLD